MHFEATPFRLLVIAASIVFVAGCNSGSSGDGAAAACGNGRIDPGERCDGDDLAGRQCVDFGLDPKGRAACNDDCTFDLAGCSGARCGNGRVDVVPVPDRDGFPYCEQCDASDSGTVSCAGLGGSGSPVCNESCIADVTTCEDVCGNGRLEDGESCDFGVDGTPIVRDGLTCASLGLGEGELFCEKLFGVVPTPAGETVVSGCFPTTFGCAVVPPTDLCGDGIAVDFEDCDGADLAGFTCNDFGLTGTLRCQESCLFDTSECVPAAGPSVCGNGIVEDGEECDGSVVAPAILGERDLQCLLQNNFVGLDLCTIGCRFDRAACDAVLGVVGVANCGDGVANSFEECDGGDLRGVTCSDLGGTGELRCSELCLLDRRGCEGVAGNGRREAGEPCDVDLVRCYETGDCPIDVGGATCESLGYEFGSVFCTFVPRRTTSVRGVPSDPYLLARLDTVFCSPSGTCGNGILDVFSEDCDGTDLGGATCATFDGEGELGCTNACRYDLSGCRDLSQCGDGRVTFGEECEPGDLRGLTCERSGGTGALVCDPQFCFLDFTGCPITCPDYSGSATAFHEPASLVPQRAGRVHGRMAQAPLDPIPRGRKVPALRYWRADGRTVGRPR